MDNKDKKRFSDLMLGMADNFRDTISKEGMKLRFEMLKEFTIDQVEDAGQKIMRERKYTKMPPVAEFVDAINGQSVSIEMQAEQQWNEIISQIRLVGSYGTPVLCDHITKSLIGRRFSWQNLCHSTENDLRFIRKEFFAAYATEYSSHDCGLLGYQRQDAKLSGLAGNMLGDVNE